MSLDSLANYYRSQLKARGAQASAQVETAHVQAKQEIQPHLEHLYQEISTKQQEGTQPPLSWLHTGKKLERLTQIVGEHIGKFASGVKGAIDQLVQWAFSLGQQAGQAFLPGSGRSAKQPSTATDSGLFGGFAAEAVKGVKDAFKRAISLGSKPNTLAREVTQALDVSRHRSLTILDTELFRSFNAAVTALFQDGWIWHCQLNPRSCFPAGTAVQTEDGEKPIELICPGERVLTHTGRYQRVMETIVTPGIFQTTTIRTEDGAVSSTLDHPFLVKRQGHLNWIEARHLRVGDHVFRQVKGAPEVSDHSVSNRIVEWSIWQADNSVSSGLEPKRFASVPFFDVGFRMPIQTIDFKTGIKCWQKEINGVMPSWESMFLSILNTEHFKADACSSLGLSFACKTSVATNRAEEFSPLLCRNDAKFFPAIFAGLDNGWASTFFRAILIIGSFLTHNFAAAFARDINHLCTLAGIRAVNLFFDTLESCKNFAAVCTRFRMSLMRHTAFIGTIVSRAIMECAKLFVASLADQGKGWFSFLSFCGMWMLSLIKRVARLRAESPVSLFSPCLRNLKSSSTDFTDLIYSAVKADTHKLFSVLRGTKSMFLFFVADKYPCISTANRTLPLDLVPISLESTHFHASIITQIDTHFHPTIKVYNMEVEEDHSYVANRFVVHNCACCVALHGTIHSLGEQLYDHPNGSCIKIPYCADIPVIQTGLEWFKQQSEETQQAILGTKIAWELYQSGAGLQAFVGQHHDATYGTSVYQKSAKELMKGR